MPFPCVSEIWAPARANAVATRAKGGKFGVSKLATCWWVKKQHCRRVRSDADYVASLATCHSGLKTQLTQKPCQLVPLAGVGVTCHRPLPRRVRVLDVNPLNPRLLEARTHRTGIRVG